MTAALLLAVALTRTITPGAAGPNRLDVDVALLGAAQPRTLADLRLRDAAGSEVPYLLIEPPSRTPAWRSGRILPIAATKKTSGFEADFGAAAMLDRIAIEGIDAPFLKRLKLEGGGDRTRWTLLAAEATVFDLPEEKLKNLEVSFEPGEYRYLRVTWDDSSSARARPDDVRARVHDSGAPPAPVKFPVSYRAVPGERGKSRYRLTLPGPHLPVEAIELQVTNANVDRAASVSEPRLAGSTVAPVELGASTLRRAQRDGGVAEDMDVEISAPEGPDLDLTVDNGSNPPLSIRAIVARLAPQPWIYFESADGKPITAAYGDPMATAPRYDLEASRRGIASTNVAIAKWSVAAPASGADRRPGAAAATPLGAPVDRKPFRYARTIGAMPRGLTSLVLDAHVLANSTTLNDVRLTDANGNQVPYLIERRESPLAIRLAIPQRQQGEGTSSRYALALPFDALPSGTQLVIRTNARVFDRHVTLRKPAEQIVVATTQWRSSEPESDPPPLTLTAPSRGARSLQLEIDEGDNAPLPLISAELLLPSSALRFISPGTPLTLLYGNPGAAPPRYDLALLAPRLFGESSREVTLASVPPPDSADGPSRERKIFWVVIAAAAVVLLLTLRRLLSGVSAPAG